MNIEFISHASFITSVRGKNIICDPWLISKVFNDSWSLLSEPAIVDWSSIDYIFVSHEHPDHFNLPTLKSIAIEDRERIKILYQKHASERLKKAFIKLNFKEVVELPIYKWKEIDCIHFYCGSSGSMDAFLAIKHEDTTVLNLNDCIFNSKQYKYIKRELGNIDILFTQFSFANWVGNDRDEHGDAKKKITEIKSQIEIFKPKYTIPFASFIFFCNEENSRMNAWINTPKIIQQQNISTLHFMYPADQFDTGNPKFSSDLAVEKYMNDYQKINIDKTPDTVDLKSLKFTIQENLTIFKKKINPLFRRMIKPFSIYIRDLDITLLINPQKATVSITDYKNAKYEMCSQVCWFMFKWSWGTGTLKVSGMYLDLKPEEPMSKYFFFQNMISTEFMLLTSIKQSLRTLKFFYRKKWELFYRFF